MKEREFNLADEPWIQVMQKDCAVRQVSLKEALIYAHQYVRLAGEMEAQNVAILRLLIALTHTIFTRVNLAGEADPVEDDEDYAITRWNDLNNNGCMPEKPVLDYFEKWHDRFWLFDPDHPFFQVPEAASGTPNTAAKLNGEVSESNNKFRLFSFISGEGREGMEYAESARWLLFLNGFDDCAAKQRDKSLGKRSFTVGWLGKLGLVTVEGENLFETILLNMPMVLEDGAWKEEDLPAWELPEPCAEERRTIAMPENLAGLLTLQSRRILLRREEDLVTGYFILGGDAFSEQNAIREPMTLWRRTQEKKDEPACTIPRRHERAKQIWRDFGALVAQDGDSRRPGVLSWVSRLKEKGLLPGRPLVTLRIYSVRYDSSQSSSITDSFSDSITFHSELLRELGKDWIRAIIDQIGLIDSAADAVGNLAVNLGKAAGQHGDVLTGASKTAKEQLYVTLDIPFRDWLLELDPEQDPDERLDLEKQWKEQARRTALEIGREMVDQKGDAAFVGRMVKDKNKERHYSAPEAYRWFRYRMNEIYPYAERR